MLEQVLPQSKNEGVKNSQQNRRNRFFDPKTPEQPTQVLGVDTDALIRLGRAATALGILSPEVNNKLRTLPSAISLVPLIESVNFVADIEPEDITAYRKPIKGLSLRVAAADKAAAAAGAFAIGIPIRRAINNKIEREFPTRANKMILDARVALSNVEDRLESDIDCVASYENPRQQLVGELKDVAEQVMVEANEQRVMRLQNDSASQVGGPVPKGLLGLVTVVVRTIKNFFGHSRQKSTLVNETTAYDAGIAIKKVFSPLMENVGGSRKRLPMISELILSRLPKQIELRSDQLALFAPELLNFIFSALPANNTAEKLISSVRRNPHELRFMTRIKKNYRNYSLERIQRASTELLPALRDVLPTSGDRVREIYKDFLALLEKGRPLTETTLDNIQSTQPQVPKTTVWNRLKQRLLRLKK